MAKVASLSAISKACKSSTQTAVTLRCLSPTGQLREWSSTIRTNCSWWSERKSKSLPSISEHDLAIDLRHAVRTIARARDLLWGKSIVKFSHFIGAEGNIYCAG